MQQACHERAVVLDALDSDETLKLENQLCFVLYGLSRKITGLYRPLLDELGLTYPQYLVMLVLWEAFPSSPETSAELPLEVDGEIGVPVKYLCEKLLLDTGTLTPLLKRLEASNLVERRRSAKDERAVLISLTQQGRALKQKAKTVPVQLLCNSKLPIHELGPLQKELRKLLLQME